MNIQPFFDPQTYTLTYLVYDEQSKDALVIDPVLDYEPGASKTSTESVEKVARQIDALGLNLHYVFETHAHADHLSGSQYLRDRFAAKVAVGARITEVQETFKGFFDLPKDFAVDGSQFDRLLTDGEKVDAGSLSVKVLFTPGHTPACISLVIGDAVFTGDALFAEDYGVGRCDFPKGNAGDLYTSVHERLYALPAETRVFFGHDYLPGGRELRTSTTILRSKEENIHLRQSTRREDFVEFRKKRDATLSAPRLLLPSVQININAGRMPEPHENGRRYLSIPIAGPIAGPKTRS